MKHSKLYIRRIAAELLAKTLVELFPKSQIIETSTSEMGFSCEFNLSHPIDPQALKLIEEGMQRTIQESIDIESVDMVASNAAGLFRHRRQFCLTEQLLEDPKQLLKLVRIGEYYGVCETPHPVDTKEIGVVKLIQSIEGETTLIKGIVFPDRKQLKGFIKKIKQQRNLDHVTLGRELDLFSIIEGVCWWHPLGEEFRQQLLRWWRIEHKKMGYDFYHTNGNTEQFIAYLAKNTSTPLMSAQIEEYKTEKSFYNDSGLFQLSIETEDSVIALVDEEKCLESMISYLQFIKKTVNMTSIDYRWIRFTQRSEDTGSQKERDLRVNLLDQALEACEIKAELETESERSIEAPGIELVFVDSLEREWSGPSVELFDSRKIGFSHHKNHYVMKSSFFRSLERFVALLVEAHRGEMPVWMEVD